MTEPATSPTTSRREFLKLGAAGTAVTLGRPWPARAEPKTITILHESSFIEPFDNHLRNVLAPAYEKLTGVKIVYQTTSIGGLPPAISTIVETGSGPDIAMNVLFEVIQFGEKYLDVGDIAEA